MTNKSNNKNNNKKNNKPVKQSTAVVRQPQKKATPFRDVGGILGKTIGGMFGVDGSGVGRWLGSGVGSVFGSGDYELSGPSPSYNVLMNGAQIPKFSTTHSTNIVSHREYLGDVSGTTNFAVTSYPLNPGMSATFPWLAAVAQNYQQYRCHGMIFEFRSLITDFVTSGSPGVIIMATNYDAVAPVYNTKQQMENSEFAVSVKPTTNLMHGIECKQDPLGERYVRFGSTGTADLKSYDTGTFQIATQGNPAQLLGELWVTYTYEFLKPIVPATIGGNLSSYRYNGISVTNAIPFGTPVFSIGSMVTLITSGTTLAFTAEPSNEYFICVTWLGTPGAITQPTFTFTGCVLLNGFKNGTWPYSRAPDTASSTGIMETGIYVRATITSPGLVSIALAGGVYPGSSQVDVLVTTIDSSAVNM